MPLGRYFFILYFLFFFLRWRGGGQVFGCFPMLQCLFYSWMFYLIFWRVWISPRYLYLRLYTTGISLEKKIVDAVTPFLVVCIFHLLIFSLGFIGNDMKRAIIYIRLTLFYSLYGCVYNRSILISILNPSCCIFTINNKHNRKMYWTTYII